MTEGLDCFTEHIMVSRSPHLGERFGMIETARPYLLLCSDQFLMADYWKSNPRKFCEICGCWMADNKISVQNHEGGMRHKANVDKKMNELLRTNKNAEREEQKLKNSLQRINDNAFVSMMKDLEKDPSLAKRYGVVLTDQAHKEIKEKLTEAKKNPGPTQSKEAAKPSSPAVCEWQEVTAPDGRKYYWNTTKNITQWNKPAGSIAPEHISVKKEKNRLQDFVLNRLVELSESGSDSATAAVHEAFNAPVPKPQVVTDVPAKRTQVERNESDTSVAQFQGPRIDLLGPWVTVTEPIPTKLPKLDLPENSDRFGSNCYFQRPSLTDETLDVLTHLEEATEANIQSSRQLVPSEKQLPAGSVSASHSKFNNSKQSTKPEAPRVLFRRGPNSNTSRNFRTGIQND